MQNYFLDHFKEIYPATTKIHPQFLGGLSASSDMATAATNTPRPSHRLLKTSMVRAQSGRNRMPTGSCVPSQATNTAQAPSVVSADPRIATRQLCGSTVLNSTSSS